MNTNETCRTNSIVFASEPAGQLNQAFELLKGLPHCEVSYSPHEPDSLIVSYDLHHYTLQDLEAALEQEGFKLDHSLLHSASRQVIYYCEDTMCHNLDIPVHPTKKNEKGVFACSERKVESDEIEEMPAELRNFN